MKTRSVLYNYNKDRSICGIEHMLTQGWDTDVNFATINTSLPLPVRQKLDEHLGLPPKRRKAAKRDAEVVLKESAGAGMCLWDISLFCYSSLLAQENEGLWEFPPSDLLFDLGEASARTKLTLVNPDDTVSLHKHFQGSDGEEELAADCVDEEDMD